MAEAVSDWSSLPQDLVYSVIDRLPEFQDFLRFCWVCKTWRSTALIRVDDNTMSTIHQQNLELLKANRNELPMLYEVGGPSLSLYSVTGAIYNVGTNIPYSFGTYNGWLFTVFDIVNDSNLITLVNPLLNKSFHLPVIQYPSFKSSIASYDHFFKALLLPTNSSSSSSSSQIRVEDRDTYHVVLLYGDNHGGGYSKKLACLKSRDMSWNMLEYTGLLNIYDIICYQGKLYALGNGARVYNIDITTGSYELVVDRPPSMPNNRYHQLVESYGGDLLLVCREFRMTRRRNHLQMIIIRKYAKIKVYKLSPSSSSPSSLSWHQVRTIGEEALFLSKYSSFSVSTREFPMCKPNSAYYEDGYFDITQSYDNRELLLDIARTEFFFREADFTPSIFTGRYYIWSLPYLKT